MVQGGLSVVWCAVVVEVDHAGSSELRYTRLAQAWGLSRLSKVYSTRSRNRAPNTGRNVELLLYYDVFHNSFPDNVRRRRN